MLKTAFAEVNFLKYVYVCVCMWVLLMSTGATEARRRVTASCELLDFSAGTKLRSFARVGRA